VAGGAGVDAGDDSVRAETGERGRSNQLVAGNLLVEAPLRIGCRNDAGDDD